MKQEIFLNADKINMPLDFLRKQRDGLIVGEYRNILYKVYQSIAKLSQNGCICKLSELHNIDETLNIYPLGILFSYCADLEYLGYISVCKKDMDYILHVIKDIDF